MSFDNGNTLQQVEIGAFWLYSDNSFDYRQTMYDLIEIQLKFQLIIFKQIFLIEAAIQV